MPLVRDATGKTGRAFVEALPRLEDRRQLLATVRLSRDGDRAGMDLQAGRDDPPMIWNPG